MDNNLLNKFQENVSNVLIRHRNVLDVISKYQESCSRVNRAVVKSVTSCGCININTTYHNIPDNISYEELKNFTKHHISGELCDLCKDKLEEEIGNHLFYLAAICNTLELDLYHILEKQSENISMLGKYSLY
jgi:predicted house-cleaning noncanonical NTP pyrophosphatase (MazG superfamily)